MVLNPPTVDFSVDPVFETNDSKYISPSTLVKIVATDAEVPVADISYTIDDGQPMDYQTPIKLSSGTHTIKAKAIDLVGNESEETNITLIVDATIPEAELTPTLPETNQ
jgi:hypothetical protein